ncbi:MAG: hypothetical protein HUJ68_07185 [Clostridia bacterium]|nr:hypothetical protein [Clostridia bacterium]
MKNKNYLKYDMEKLRQFYLLKKTDYEKNSLEFAALDLAMFLFDNFFEKKN